MAVYVPRRTVVPGGGIDSVSINGVEAFPRTSCSALTHPSGTGTMRMVYVTPGLTQTVSKFVTNSGTTAAAATPTLCKVGLYTVASNGDITLVARTANTTSLWAGTQTEYETAMDATGGYVSSYTVQAGRRYAIGILCVTGATAPTFTGASVAVSATMARTPRLTGAVTSQADLPTSVATGSIVASGSAFYAALVA